MDTTIKYECAKQLSPLVAEMIDKEFLKLCEREHKERFTPTLVTIKELAKVAISRDTYMSELANVKESLVIRRMRNLIKAADDPTYTMFLMSYCPRCRIHGTCMCDLRSCPECGYSQCSFKCCEKCPYCPRSMIYHCLSMRYECNCRLWMEYVTLPEAKLKERSGRVNEMVKKFETFGVENWQPWAHNGIVADQMLTQRSLILGKAGPPKPSKRRMPTISRYISGTDKPISQMKIQELRNYLTSLGLPITGKKEELIERIRYWFYDHANLISARLENIRQNTHYKDQYLPQVFEQGCHRWGLL